MKKTLLIWLQAPMQSWGTTSRFDERDTQLEPSKSGVIGILCAALGRDRSESIEDLANLKMGVRVISEGFLMKDYQTAQGVYQANSKVDKKRTVISPRYYLADASFLVGFESTDHDLLTKIHAALKNPVWFLYLGRKSFVPSMPLFIKEGIVNKPLRDSLIGFQTEKKNGLISYRLLIENENEGAMRLDQPDGSFLERRFRPRYVMTEIVTEDEPVINGDIDVFNKN